MVCAMYHVYDIFVVIYMTFVFSHDNNHNTNRAWNVELQELIHGNG